MTHGARLCRMMQIDLDKAMETARRAVEAAAQASLAHFRRGVRVETKPDRTPVTAADREAEAAIFAVIKGAFPDHALLGEESGAHAGAVSEARWIVDPLDGTRGFSRGGVFWGPLVALELEGRIVASAMALPALGERYWAARGLGAWHSVGDDSPARLQVSGISEWREATFSMGEPSCLLAPPYRDGVIQLATSAASTRCVGDLAGCAMVLTGRAEAWVEAGMKIWDVAPFAVLVEEAGGRFSDLAGVHRVDSGSVLASNGKLHDHVLEVLGEGGNR